MGVRGLFACPCILKFIMQYQAPVQGLLLQT